MFANFACLQYSRFRVYNPSFYFLYLAIFVKYNIVNLETFGSVIKSLRIKHGLLLRQVAAVVEVDTSMVSKFEKGDRFPTKEQVEKMALLFNESPHSLYICCLSSKLVNEIGDEKIIQEVLETALTITKRKGKK